MEVTPSTLTTVVHLAGGRLVKQVSGIWDPQYLLVVTENRNCSLLQPVNAERGCHQFFAVSSPIRHYYTDHRGDLRVVYHANATTGTAEVVQEDHLTPLGVQMVGMSRTNWPGWESPKNRGDDQYYSDGWNRFEAAIHCGWSEERANAHANGYSRTYGGSSGASGTMGGGSAGAGGASGGKGSGGFVPSAKDETNPEGEKDKGKSSGDGEKSSTPLGFVFGLSVTISAATGGGGTAAVGLIIDNSGNFRVISSTGYGCGGFGEADVGVIVAASKGLTADTYGGRAEEYSASYGFWGLEVFHGLSAGAIDDHIQGPYGVRVAIGAGWGATMMTTNTTIHRFQYYWLYHIIIR